MEITILKVVKADHFWAKETPGTMMSEETRKFQQLSKQINDFFSMDQGTCVPAQGQLCVGKRPEDKLWYRVRVKTILHSKSGPLACCFLLDYAEECQIPCHWLREAPPQFMQLPWQAKEFRLYGLQPLTLITSIEDFTTTKQPCKKYDTAANEYVSKLVKESYGASVHVYLLDNNVHYVNLYLKRTTHTVCVNDDLVSKEYAKYSEDEEVKSNMRMLSPMFSPSAVPAGRVSPHATSPPPLSPDPSQRSSPCGGLAAMLGLDPMIVTEPVLMTPTANILHQAASEKERQTGTGVPSNSHVSPVIGAAVELSALAIKSPDGTKTKVSSPAEENREILNQQISGGHARDSSSVTTSPSVMATKSGHGLQNRQGTSKAAETLNTPSFKPAGKDLSPRKILKAARTLQPSSGRIIGNGSIAVNPECLKGNSGQETTWIPGVSPPMNDKSLQPALGGQDVRNRRSFPPDQVKSSGHSVRKVDEVIPRSSRSVESRLKAAYSQTSTLGKEWTQLVDKTRPVRQRSLSPIPVNVGVTRSRAKSPPVQGGKEVSQSLRVSPESISTAGGATSGHASAEKFAISKSTGMPESDVHNTGQSEQTPAAVLGNSAGRHDDNSGSNTSQCKAGSSGGASDAKAEGSCTTGAGGDNVATTITPSVHTGYTPARLPRINLHGNPLRDSLFPTLSSGSGDLSTTEPSTSEGEESPVRRKNKVPSIGERLLQVLIPQKWEEPSRTQAQLISQSPSGPPLSLAGHQMSAVGDGVAVKGDIPPKPCTMLEKTPFPEYIIQSLSTRNHHTPSKVQSYCWPAIMRGRDLVAMAPASTGKTLAYLLPVLTQLTQTAGLEGLPAGNGPRSIILCPYWKSARGVFDEWWECQKHMADKKSTRVLIIYGAGAEDDQMVPLINGCDMLIATPRCLLRMLEKRYTNLDRLCQLVVDDADTLTEVYTDEIKSLMRLYGKAIADQPDRSVPRQIVLMARQWTAGIESFHRAYMTQPLLVFTSKVEEAVYSKVKQIVSVVPSTLRYTELLNLLDQCEGAGHKIMVFVEDDEEAENVTQLLKTYSHNTLCAYTDQHQYQIDTVMKEWTTHHRKDSLPVLVLTDSVIPDLSIRDATCVIHYSFAQSALKFSARLGCMSNSFNKDASKEKRKTPGCVSFILVTEMCTKYAIGLQEIVTLVRRSGGHVSQDMLDMCSKAWMAKQIGRVDDSFCHAMKAFGHCAEQARCKARHIVVPEVDKPGEGMPTLGYVKILVTHVKDANCYFGRILKHWDWDRRAVPRENTCLPLMADIGLYYSRQENKVPVVTAQVGDLCAVRDKQNTFHRVRVTKIRVWEGFTTKFIATVFHLDEGKTEDLEVTELLNLPGHLAAVPAQAVEVFLCGVCPIDQDKGWTDMANKFTAALIGGKELEGRVALCLGHTLWMESLVERKVLQGIKATTNKHNIRRELLRVCLAEKNPDHVSLLRQACDGKMALPEYKPPSKAPPAKPGQKYSTANPPPTATLPESGFDEVYVSAVEHPGLIYVQRKHYARELEALTAEVNNEEKLVAAPVLQQVAPGRLCVAVFPQDNRWYRARIQQVQDEEMCEVFYLDHGDTAIIPRGSLKEPWEDVMQLPFQAIEACLGSIQPLQSQQWDEESGDELWGMVFEKMLFAQVLSVGPSEYGNDNRYKMELYDTSAEYDIIISQEMVMQGHGVVSGSPEVINLLFPMVDDPAWLESHPDPSEQICLLCAQLCQTSDPDHRLELAKQIDSIVINNPTKRDSMRESRGVSSVCLMLGYCTDPAVLESLAVSLGYMVISSQANCEEVRTTGGLRMLCRLLKKDYRPELQKQLVWALKHLALNEKNKETIAELGGLRTLCHLLADTKSLQVQENVCCCLGNLVTENKTNCSAVAECGALHTVCQLVKGCADSAVLEPALQLLQQLATLSANRAAITAEGGVEMLCERVQNSQTDKVLVQALRALKAVTFRCEENVAVLVDRSGVREVIERFASSHQSPEINSQCKDLLSKFGPPSKTKPVTPAKPPVNHSNGNQSEVRTSNLLSSHQLTSRQSAYGMNRPNFSHHSSSSQSESSLRRSGSSSLSSNQSASLEHTLPPQQQAGQPTSGVNSQNSSHPLNSSSHDSATQYHDIKTRKAQVLAHHWTRHKTRRPSLEPVPEGNGEPIHEEDDFNDMPPLEATEEEESPVPASGGHKIQSLHPKVLWSQQKATVTLSVQLRGLLQKPNVTFLPTALHFRSFFRGTDYILNLDLYDKVQPGGCSCRLTGSDVILTLRKEKPGPWPRLTRTKSKHPWLGIDFDRWEDVSSDSDSESEPDPRQKKNVPLPTLTQHRHKERGGLPSTLSNVILPEMDMSSDTNSHLHDSDHYSDSDGEVGGSGYKMNDPRFIGM